MISLLILFSRDFRQEKKFKKIVFQGDLHEVDFLGFKSKDIHILINGHIGNYVGFA